MADGRDVVVAVEVSGAVGGVEIDALAPDEMAGGFVEEPIGRSEGLRAAVGERFVLRREGPCAGSVGVQHGGLAGHGDGNLRGREKEGRRGEEREGGEGREEGGGGGGGCCLFLVLVSVIIKAFFGV